MFAVQFHKLGFHQLCRVVVSGNADRLSGAAYGFKDQVNDFIYPVFAFCVYATYSAA